MGIKWLQLNKKKNNETIASFNDVKPWFDSLRQQQLNAGNIHDWLCDWTRLHCTVKESHARLRLAARHDTTIIENKTRYTDFQANVISPFETAEQELAEKLLASGLTPRGMEAPLHSMRALANLYSPENIPLKIEEQQLIQEYLSIRSGQMFEWEGQSLTYSQLSLAFMDPDREIRKKAWNIAGGVWLRNRRDIASIWGRLVPLRNEIAANAGFMDYRDYIWQLRGRFDYTPNDCLCFHDAVAEVVVPAVARRDAKRRELLGVNELKPWDLAVDPRGRDRLRPNVNSREMLATVEFVTKQMDHELGDYISLMIKENLFDLDSRPGKAPGYFTEILAQRWLPYVFANFTGVHSDVRVIFHLCGHCIQVASTAHLPYHHQRYAPVEITELSSRTMELYSMPYWSAKKGGFYTEYDTARAYVQQYDGMLARWLHIAQGDAFQCWAYNNPAQAADVDRCDEQWAELRRRFIPTIDPDGNEDVLATGWQGKHYFFADPFHWIEFGIAQLGAVQLWDDIRREPEAATNRCERVLELGATRSLADLYAELGIKLNFGCEVMGEATRLIEQDLEDALKRQEFYLS